MKDEISGGEERRDYFRVKYPPTEGPKLTITKEAFDVIDISEQGIRFDFGTIIHATITFHDGESLNIEAKLLRAQNKEIVIQPTKNIPYERILKEQRYLMKKYPGYR